MISCAPTYQPNRIHAPMHGRAEEFAGGASLGFDGSAGIDLSGTLTDHMMVRGGASFGGAMSPGQTFFEIGLGAYDTVVHSPMRYSFSGLYGRGQLPVHSLDLDTAVSSKRDGTIPYTRMGFQVDGGYHSPSFEFFLASRFVMVGHNFFDEGGWTYLLEPGFGGRIGGENVKFEIQMSIDIPLKNDIRALIWPLQLSVGMTARFH
jgi:hypothetical protein